MGTPLQNDPVERTQTPFGFTTGSSAMNYRWPDAGGMAVLLPRLVILGPTQSPLVTKPISIQLGAIRWDCMAEVQGPNLSWDYW
jgi:hypothetical protein